MREFWHSLVEFFVSLKLTVVLLALSIILVFWATLAQVQLGVWGVQEHFFRTFFVLGKIPGTQIPVPLFPGGYFIGTLLLLNLLTAHISRFKLTWRKSGIQLTHAGLILLLVGELLSGLWQEEYQMRLDEGQTKNYSESYRDSELAIIDTTNPDYDDVVAVPDRLLARLVEVQNPKLPFRVVVRDYFPNASLQMRNQMPDAPATPATVGIGPSVVATPLPLTYKQDERNLAAAFVELIGPEGSLGTWLVSTQVTRPQSFDYAGRTFALSLRFARNYKPFSLQLLDFRHDVYAGTAIPKNFSSRIKLMTPDGREDREVLIYMNNPLRYAGLTFYQASYVGDHTTILQVVHNPSWMLPYVSCVMMMLGLLIQFGISLFRFSANRRAAA
ncbi:MAG: cytochrome c biogenesis protein ResB [Cephaloticoccus sp.]|nr:cytochrome c biogenesis protein ResB [Cephaloticoccus sp.]MCF7761412.1 cytochrome c biogenesis protein ResB [Cephaloticoccus sp.]